MQRARRCRRDDHRRAARDARRSAPGLRTAAGQLCGCSTGCRPTSGHAARCAPAGPWPTWSGTARAPPSASADASTRSDASRSRQISTTSAGRNRAISAGRSDAGPERGLAAMPGYARRCSTSVSSPARSWTSESSDGTSSTCWRQRGQLGPALGLASGDERQTSWNRVATSVEHVADDALVDGGAVAGERLGDVVAERSVGGRGGQPLRRRRRAATRQTPAAARGWR